MKKEGEEKSISEEKEGGKTEGPGYTFLFLAADGEGGGEIRRGGKAAFRFLCPAARTREDSGRRKKKKKPARSSQP